ncbi:MAG TPA: cell division protein FtsX [Crenotrichaceae bacterium]|nr:cell division protein FtsX [Crenotrichaceae bacterium]
MKHYLELHIRAAVQSLGQLTQKRLASMATIIVIAIALALPSAFYLLVQNLSKVSEGLGDSTRLTVFLDTAVDQPQAKKLAKKISRNDDVSDVTIISKQQGLEELKQYSGFADTIKALQDNPLPIVLQVQPVKTIDSPEKLDTLMSKLRTLSGVDIVQLDLMLVKRLRALMSIGKKLATILGILFCFAVIFIVGNTIRLELQTRHDELEITKLMGATNHFVRRPFLYTGAWLGLFGSLIACLIVAGMYLAIYSPTEALSGLYESTFQLQFLTMSDVGMIILTGLLAGVLGAWISATRHLRQIDMIE